MWISIISGAALWTTSLSILVTLAFSITYLSIKHANFMKTLVFTQVKTRTINWYNDIFPFQWRIALSWISGYFCFNLFTPILMKYHGSIIAGQMGLTWNVITYIGLVSAAWFQPKIPSFCIMIAKKQYHELDQLFWKTTTITLSLNIVISVLFFGAIFILNKLHHPFADRFLPPFATGIFLAAQFIQQAAAPFSSYLRAHKREPLLFISVGTGLLTAISLFVFGKAYAVPGMAFSYLAVNVIMIPWVFIVWYRCRNIWRGEDIADGRGIHT